MKLTRWCAIAVLILLSLALAGIGATRLGPHPSQRPAPAPTPSPVPGTVPAPYDYCAQMGQARHLVAASLVRPWLGGRRDEALAMLDDLLREC